MKCPAIRVICALLLCASLASCKPSAGDPAQLDWIADLQSAAQTAQKENKLLLIYFAGSDWSAPCMAMQKDVLNTAGFKAFTDSYAVVYMADFPRDKKLPADAVDINTKMAKQFDVTGYPTVVVVAPQAPQMQFVTKITSNPGSPSALINQIRSALPQPAQKK